MPRHTPSPSPSPGPTPTPLTFYGGLAGALAPFVAFLSGVAWLALNGAPDEKGFWPILLGALMLGLLLARDRERYAEAMLDGMSERVVMVMLCAWLFAGVMGAVLSAGGLVTGLAWASRTVGLGGGAYVGRRRCVDGHAFVGECRELGRTRCGVGSAASQRGRDGALCGV
jgi:hypothetical protein